MKPIPTISQGGVPSETFLENGDDGIIRVKDGRTLEEYINDPRLVDERKGKAQAMAVCSLAAYERSLIPHVA